MTLPKVAVLGTGVVGQTLSARLAELGYGVSVGARSADSESLTPFATMSGVTPTDFATAAAGASVIINATNGGNSIAALEQAGAANLAGKTVIDVSNELVPVEGGGFPRPAASADNSLGQRIQATFPEARVVKALNTMNCAIMANPAQLPGDHVVFLSGDDGEAKNDARAVLASFGWRPAQIVDLGGIETAAAVEMTMSLWMAVMAARGFSPFNWAIMAAD